jgi:hypothetical protein
VIERIFSPDSDGELPHAIPLPQLIDLMTDLWEGEQNDFITIVSVEDCRISVLYMLTSQQLPFFPVRALSFYLTTQRTAFSIEAWLL